MLNIRTFTVRFQTFGLAKNVALFSRTSSRSVEMDAAFLGHGAEP